MLTGTLTGFLLKGGASVRRKVALLLAWGAVATAAGLLWGRFLPINKNLWTASYVVFTSGAALLALGLCLFVIDVLGWKKPFAPFFTFGTNPLLVFVLSGLLAKTMNLVRWTDAAGKTISLQAWVYRAGLLVDRGPDAALARVRARHDPLLVGRPARFREEGLVLEDLSPNGRLRSMRL